MKAELGTKLHKERCALFVCFPMKWKHRPQHYY